MLSPEPKPISMTSPPSPAQARRRIGATDFIPPQVFRMCGRTRLR
jgi:hypothetical protein